MYRRNIVQSIFESRADTPVQLLVGARQTGKSTLALQIAGKEGIPYRTLDDATVLSAAASDPEGFLRGLGDRAVIDEVQRVPDLLLAIKASVDKDRQPGKYLLTGSSNIMTLPRISESLAGRVEVHTLRPLSQGEIEGNREHFIDTLFEKTPDIKVELDKNLMQKRVVRGGYPEVLTREKIARRRAWFESYISTVLSRDVRDIANIEHLNQLPRLLSLLAARNGSMLNYSELSNSSALPQSTLKRYLGILEKLFIFEPLPAWSSNRGKRLVKSPKVFISDCGLSASLLGIGGERLGDNELSYGPLLEAFVLGELRKQSGWTEGRYRLYHYRSASGNEVDVVVESADGSLVGLEVKGKVSVKANDFKGMHALKEHTGSRFMRGIILYSGEKTVAFSEKMAAVPIAALWKI
ncbi:MAG: ATP-binding protein [Spirochaetia bacterium]|nr:ATP-binding protein [Spirochaetia bacterium]